MFNLLCPNFWLAVYNQCTVSMDGDIFTNCAENDSILYSTCLAVLVYVRQQQPALVVYVFSFLFIISDKKKKKWHRLIKICISLQCICGSDHGCEKEWWCHFLPFSVMSLFEDAFTEEPTDVYVCIFMYTHRHGSYSALLKLCSFNLLA